MTTIYDTILDMKNILIILTMLVLTFLMAGRLFAEEITEAQAVQCIMGEARGEPYEGQVAVGEVLRKRGKLSGFYGCFANFKATQGEFKKAQKAWRESSKTDYSNGATHFEGDSFKQPYWAKDMKVVAHIGRQTFYAKGK